MSHIIIEGYKMFRVIQSLFLFLGFVTFIACGGGSTGSKKADNQLENNIEEDTEEESNRIYGVKGKYSVASPWEEPDSNMSVVYYPSIISKSSPTPVVFFAPGWESVNHKSYETLLKFIASHGYTVIYAKDDTGAYSGKHLIRYFREMMNNSEVEPYVDTSRIGVIGHSSGGGHAFKILKEFSDEGWGSKGRFLLSLDPWFAFDMNKSDMKALPSNTNVVIIQFGKGGESKSNGTDTRVPLSEYYLLSSIPKSQKDYQVYESATHSYPVGAKNYNEMQGILKPLDALMEYTFKSSKNLKAHQVALEVGSDDPYKNGQGIQSVKATDTYHYRCDGNDNSGAIRTLVETDIDYCAMEK